MFQSVKLETLGLCTPQCNRASSRSSVVVWHRRIELCGVGRRGRWELIVSAGEEKSYASTRWGIGVVRRWDWVWILGSGLADLPSNKSEPSRGNILLGQPV